MDQFSERRLIENEVLFRSANQKVQKQVQKDRPRRQGKDNTKLHFYCECSNLYCRDRIKLTADEYELAATGRKEFIVIPGHENHAVEKVLRETDTFNVVEKFRDPAKVMSDSKLAR